MTFIGASLEDLANVSGKYKITTGVIRDSGSTVVSTVNGAVSALQAETTRAETTCINSIEAMKADMANTWQLLSAAQYVGKNADVAREAGSELDQRCAQAVADMSEAFANFRTQINGLGENLTEIATGYDRYAAEAAESGDSMSDALAKQRDNLEQAMSGMTYG